MRHSATLRSALGGGGGGDKYAHMLLVLGCWSLVLFEASIYEERIGTHLGILVCLRFCFPYLKYYIALSFRGSEGRPIADRHEKI